MLFKPTTLAWSHLNPRAGVLSAVLISIYIYLYLFYYYYREIDICVYVGAGSLAVVSKKRSSPTKKLGI